MTEIMTLVLLLLWSFIGGTVATFLIAKKNKIKCSWQLISSWLVYCYFEYWILNVWRMLLLKGKNIYAYSQDYSFFATDLVLIVSSTLFLYYSHNVEKRNIKWCHSALCLLITVYYIVFFGISFFRYHNVNAAIYNGLMPVYTACFGLVLFSLYSLFEKKKREKIGSVEVATIVSFVTTVVFYPVTETYLSNIEEFSIPFISFLGWGVLFSVLICVLITWICYAISGKARVGFLFCLWGFSICAYVQGMFLNGELFLLDGKEAQWGLSVKLKNLAIWGFVLLIALIIFKSVKKYRKEIVLFTSVLLSGMQIVAGVSLLPNLFGHEENNARGEQYFSTQGLYEVATDENIVVFVLDTYDVDHINEVLEQSPEFLEKLKGFTYFPDTVAQFPRTFPSIIYMLTGQPYFYEMPWQEYVTQAFQNSMIWDDLLENEYGVYFYEDKETYIGSTIRTKASNYVEKGQTIEEKTSFIGCVEAIVRINGYRLLPYVWKENYFYTADMINDLVVSEFLLENPEYVEDDAAVYQGLKENGLSVSDEKKAFRFIHMTGAHEPYIMDEAGNRLEIGTGNSIAQYKGCMNFVFDYISMLQKMGVYEKTTIMITADHGENFLFEKLNETTNPILFVKPYGVGAENPLEISDFYASQNDILPTIANIHNLNCKVDGGLDLFSADGLNKERVRYHYYTVVEDNVQTHMCEYEIKGSSLNFDNWYTTGEYKDFGIYY